MFRPPLKRSKYTLFPHLPPSVHLVAYSTGGLRELFKIIKNDDVPSLPKFGEYTDDEGCFVPQPEMPLLAYRYQFLHIIGKGQSSVFIKAQDTFRSSHLVAIKVLHGHYSRLGTQETDCIRRLNIADPSDTAGTLRLMTTFSFHKHYCMVFELLAPEPLNFYFRGLNSKQAVHSIRKVALRVLKTLGFLQQQNVIHADLKPDNILLQNKNDIASLKVVDFGNAIHCIHEELSLYYDDFELQTLLYRAPEVLYGLPFGVEIDMWSLGCILAELYCEKPIFCGRDKEEVLTEMVDWLGPLPGDVFKSGKFFHELNSFSMLQPDIKHVTTPSLMAKIGCQDYAFVDFIRKLLMYKPSERMTVSEAACHPYLAAESGLVYLAPPNGIADYPTVLLDHQNYTKKPYIAEQRVRQHLTPTQLLYEGTTVTLPPSPFSQARVAVKVSLKDRGVQQTGQSGPHIIARQPTARYPWEKKQFSGKRQKYVSGWHDERDVHLRTASHSTPNTNTQIQNGSSLNSQGIDKICSTLQAETPRQPVPQYSWKASKDVLTMSPQESGAAASQVREPLPATVGHEKLLGNNLPFTNGTSDGSDHVSIKDPEKMVSSLKADSEFIEKKTWPESRDSILKASPKTRRHQLRVIMRQLLEEEERLKFLEEQKLGAVNEAAKSETGQDPCKIPPNLADLDSLKNIVKVEVQEPIPESQVIHNSPINLSKSKPQGGQFVLEKHTNGLNGQSRLPTTQNNFKQPSPARNGPTHETDASNHSMAKGTSSNIKRNAETAAANGAVGDLTSGTDDDGDGGCQSTNKSQAVAVKKKSKPTRKAQTSHSNRQKTQQCNVVLQGTADSNIRSPGVKNTDSQSFEHTRLSQPSSARPPEALRSLEVGSSGERARNCHRKPAITDGNHNDVTSDIIVNDTDSDSGASRSKEDYNTSPRFVESDQESSVVSRQRRPNAKKNGYQQVSKDIPLVAKKKGVKWKDSESSVEAQVKCDVRKNEMYNAPSLDNQETMKSASPLPPCLKSSYVSSEDEDYLRNKWTHPHKKNKMAKGQTRTKKDSSRQRTFSQDNQDTMKCKKRRLLRTEAGETPAAQFDHCPSATELGTQPKVARSNSRQVTKKKAIPKRIARQNDPIKASQTSQKQYRRKLPNLGLYQAKTKQTSRPKQKGRNDDMETYSQENPDSDHITKLPLWSPISVFPDLPPHCRTPSLKGSVFNNSNQSTEKSWVVTETKSWKVTESATNVLEQTLPDLSHRKLSGMPRARRVAHRQLHTSDKDSQSIRQLHTSDKDSQSVREMCPLKARRKLNLLKCDKEDGRRTNIRRLDESNQSGVSSDETEYLEDEEVRQAIVRLHQINRPKTKQNAAGVSLKGQTSRSLSPFEDEVILL